MINAAVGVGASMAVHHAMNRRVFERNPRRGVCQPEFLQHRFPIKGGLTWVEFLAEHMKRTKAVMQFNIEQDLFGNAN